MRKIHVVIGLGSNINAEQNIPAAIEELKQIGEVLKSSEVLITKPIGITNQDDFFNSAVLLQTDDDFDILNIKLKVIEDKMGRNRSRPKFGPREIDLDIVVYDNEITDEDYYTRDFLQKLVAQVWSKK
ncbi:2-amino-4-hydroxy-6-hydroxymethyldihydropteridine diphosphokinase [Carboxylicivirga marina]|uniref:2-amino-4-hydroxy-6-hydroxymethyldihydropteridine pyrophosphokinase n=1 Tax=Carboxylicivirga marina TaxID=2800988 RepID=A0ABS1HIB6_9BACT|nr:2-amino-4-hydroxy-6-hydroxymethyldihydropteridine diphosphokinase [Carboxylicivirga marina]MBK3517392.1 2-amino-4-hydroxy-6-hydroxymethyldihydropteridine diphosphokinase [Carboxylicivirga marina]